MSDEHAVPEFTLPDWGHDGAPPEPPAHSEHTGADASPSDPLEIHVEHPPLLTTTTLPDRWTVETVHGLVTGHGSSEADDPAAAAAKAGASAIEALEEAARELGANAVTGIGLNAFSRKGVVVVTAAGTAVRLSR